ncbi:MAG: aminotransferase class I/II-fold pyridoxal phosphate-dependent enzyme [Hyphomicrobiaceae bacterium]|nr:MAG: aminotransferase class I/II-fold pyridoxal phosphate-dependent enzyme [Hyphomicrobiaceae bacterium]
MKEEESLARERLLRAASRRSAIDPFIVMDVMRAANEREARQTSPADRVIHMEVGQPATPAPRAALAAVERAFTRSNLGYTEALGMPELRERIAQLYREWHGLEVDPGRIVVTLGSSGAFILAFLALFDVGARVALPSPGYPCYRHIVRALGLEPISLVTDESTRWMPDAGEVRKLASEAAIDGLLLASPANPTGTMLGRERLCDLVHACEKARVWFISDEIYHGLTYAEPAATAIAFSDQAIIVNSFSKYFSMTGWRIGWLVVPLGLVRTIERLAQNLFICPPAVSQVAALGAFEGMEELEGHKRTYAANRAILLEELPKAGLGRILPADGAFYIYADVSERAASSAELARRMLQEIGVAATPGLDFDAERGERYLRFSYAGSTADIAEAARRIKGWLGNQSR